MMTAFFFKITPHLLNCLSSSTLVFRIFLSAGITFASKCLTISSLCCTMTRPHIAEIPPFFLAAFWLSALLFSVHSSLGQWTLLPFQKWPGWKTSRFLKNVLWLDPQFYLWGSAKRGILPLLLRILTIADFAVGIVVAAVLVIEFVDFSCKPLAPCRPSWYSRFHHIHLLVDPSARMWPIRRGSCSFVIASSQNTQVARHRKPFQIIVALIFIYYPYIATLGEYWREKAPPWYCYWGSYISRFRTKGRSNSLNNCWV